MLPTVAALVYALPFARVAGHDTPVLKRLERALVQPSDKKAWFLAFERQCPASDVPAWQRLQRQTAPNSKQYGELSFALAYYGTDYAANLRRITRPYRLHHASYKAYIKEYGGPNQSDGDWDIDWTGQGKTWLPLNLLYLKHHDSMSLGAWLDQSYDGAPAEWNDGELGKLWKRHKMDMLRLASASPLRMHNLTDTLVFDYFDSPRSIRKLLREMQGLSRSQDTRIREVAGQIAIKVQSYVKDVDQNDKNDKEHDEEMKRQSVRQKGVGQIAPFAPRRAFAACALPLAYDKADLDELSVAISARRITGDELAGLSDADLVLLRNVPFARHGYRFHVPRLLDYFSNKAWYRPNTSSESVAERRCSPVENRNVNTIIAYQKRLRGDTAGASMQGGNGPGLPVLLTAVSERNLNENDLNGKTAWQLTIVRNTPYARHGFRFGTAKLTDYFRGKAWYRPDSGDQDVVAGRFNAFERRNIKFVADYQDAHGLRDTP